MAITYKASLKTTRMQDIVAAIDAAATPGTIEIGTASMAAVLATVTLADPCGSVTGDTLTFTMPKSDTSADGTGTAAAARVKDGDGNTVIDGLTVGVSGSGAHIIVSSTGFTAGDAFTINSGTIQHA